MRVIRIASFLALTAAALTLGVAPAVASPNLLGNRGFDRPIVSGLVVKSPGSHLGTCGSTPTYTGRDYHCWFVYHDTVSLIHDDYTTGGVAWAPHAGHQLAMLSPASATDPGGGLRQVVSVTPGLVRVGIWIAADPRSPGVMGRIQLVISRCNPVTSECQGEIGPNWTTNPSTGDPSHPGWRRIWVSFPVNEGQSLLVLDISPGTPTGPDDTAAVLIDAANVTLLR
jgi:hypothetical protein